MPERVAVCVDCAIAASVETVEHALQHALQCYSSVAALDERIARVLQACDEDRRAGA